ncbi:MAG: Flagellar hook-length control protein [Pseudothermotoga lettingae]|nr:MAG: Flagellar hook-length control protein [Pseudothermotoga lettingae]
MILELVKTKVQQLSAMQGFVKISHQTNTAVKTKQETQNDEKLIKNPVTEKNGIVKLSQIKTDLNSKIDIDSTTKNKQSTNQKTITEKQSNDVKQNQNALSSKQISPEPSPKISVEKQNEELSSKNLTEQVQSKVQNIPKRSIFKEGVENKSHQEDQQLKQIVHNNGQKNTANQKVNSHKISNLQIQTQSKSTSLNIQQDNSQKTVHANINIPQTESLGVKNSHQKTVATSEKSENDLTITIKTNLQSNTNKQNVQAEKTQSKDIFQFQKPSQTSQSSNHQRANIGSDSQNIIVSKQPVVSTRKAEKPVFQTNEPEAETVQKLKTDPDVLSISKTTKKTVQIPRSEEQQKTVDSRNLIEQLILQGKTEISTQLKKTEDLPEQKISQQSGIIAENLISEKSVLKSSQSQPAMTFKQIQLIIKNAVVQIQNSTSEFTQFRQIKREIPSQLKTSQPIKIENFKLEIAKNLKNDTPVISEQPQIEKFKQVEQVKELLNEKLARKTYEGEQITQTHNEIQKTADSVVTRIEQQERSSNIQTIVETVKEMQNNIVEKATVDLSPPNLGKVEIELIKQQDRLIITLKVQTNEAKELLEKNSKELASRLSTLGFKVEQIDIKTPHKTEEDQLSNHQEQKENQNHERRQKRQQEQEVKEDDQLN